MNDLDRILDRLDKINEDMTEVKATMARNTTSLEVHIKRTEALETKLLPLYYILAGLGGAISVISALIGVVSAIKAHL